MKRKLKKVIRKKKIEKLKLFFACVIFFIFLAILLLFNTVKKTEELKITIESPLNQTYYMENVILKVVASKTAKWIADSIDGSENLTACYNCDSYSVYWLRFKRGSHTVTVYASDYENKIAKASVVFTVI
jgi:hypothetical protein